MWHGRVTIPVSNNELQSTMPAKRSQASVSLPRTQRRLRPSRRRSRAVSLHDTQHVWSDELPDNEFYSCILLGSIVLEKRFGYGGDHLFLIHRLAGGRFLGCNMIPRWLLNYHTWYLCTFSACAAPCRVDGERRNEEYHLHRIAIVK